LTGQLIKGLGALLPDAGRLGLLLQPCGQMGRDQGGHQHHCEGHQILDVADRQGKPGRHEKDVEQQNAEDRGQDGGVAAQGNGHDQHRQQEQHDDVGQIQIAQ